MNAKFLAGIGLCLAATLPVGADTTDGSWTYVPRLTEAEQAIKDKVKGCATGVITNGDWRLFVTANETKKTLELTLYYDGWATPVTGSYIAGQGRLDLSLPILSEDGLTTYTMTKLQPNCLRTGTCPTELILPTTTTYIGNYISYCNAGNLTNVVINCPELTTMGSGLFVNGSKIASLTLNCPKLKTIQSDTFYKCTSLSKWTICLPSVTRYNTSCFYSTRLDGADPDGFNLANVTNLASYAFSGTTGLQGDVLRLDRLQTLATEALANASFGAVLIGYDDLALVDVNATRYVKAETLVIGGGRQPVTMKARAVTSNAKRIWFRGAPPNAEENAILTEGHYKTTIFFRADESGWADLPVREATGEERNLFETTNPDVPLARLAGILPQAAIGNERNAFLVYGDYRTEESRLFVDVDTRYAAECPVTPAAGMHAAEFAPGESVTLTAPADVTQIGDIKVKATKYVVSELDHFGRWSKNVTTNAYDASRAATVTMPAKGSLRVQWIFDECYAVKLAARSTQYPEQVTSGGEDVPEEIWVAGGETCTLVARATTDSQPTTRFLRWEGDIGEAEATEPTLVLMPTNALRLRAVFAHDWFVTNATVSVNGDAVMTDGNWVLKIRRMSDGADGRRKIKVGRNYDSTAIVTGEGPMDLSTRVTDAAGNEYDIHTLEYNALRPGSYGNPTLDTCTDFTAPTTVVRIGQYLFYDAHTALTNVTLNCPELTETDSGVFMLCKRLRRVYFNAPKLKNIPSGGFWTGYFCDCSALEDLYLNLPQLTCLPMKFLLHSPLTETDCSKWNLDSVTNVRDWCMGRVSSDGPHGELRLPSLEALTGSRQFAGRQGITKLVLGSGRLRLLGSQGAEDQPESTRELCRPGNALCDMTGLRHIELGLAPDAIIPDGVFNGLGRDKVTNITFTASPPSNTNIFYAVGSKTTVPSDESKKVGVYADWDNPGWRLEGGEFAETAKALDILGLGDLTAAEKAAYQALPYKAGRKRWMGLVDGTFRFAWLFHYGALPRGTLLLVR